MATDSIMGLFTKPEQYQQAQSQAALQRGVQLAQLDPLQRASAQLYQGGYLAGGAIGNALGAQDPMLQQLSNAQRIMQGVDQNDPESLANASRAFNQAGDVARARAFAQAAQEAAVKQSQIVRNTREGRAAANKVVEADGRQYLVNSLTGERIADIGAAGEKTQTTEAGGRTLLINKTTGETIRDLGPAPQRGVNVSPNISLVDKESNLRKDFTTETKPLTTIISTADRIDQLLTGNTSLGEVIARKQFAKLAGDTNISNRDVADLANFGDLGQRLSGILSGFFEGKYSEAQRQEALGLVKQLKANSANQYTTVQKQYRDRAAAENIPEKTSQFIAPDLPVASKAALPPEGTRLRNKKTGKIEVVRGGKLVPSE